MTAEKYDKKEMIKKNLSCVWLFDIREKTLIKKLLAGRFFFEHAFEKMLLVIKLGINIK